MKGRKSFIWLISGAGILVAGFVLLLGLFGIVVLAGYFSASASDEAAERVPRRRPVVFVTFEPTAAPTLADMQTPTSPSDVTETSADMSEPTEPVNEPTAVTSTPKAGQPAAPTTQPTATSNTDSPAIVAQTDTPAPVPTFTPAPQSQASNNSPLPSPTATPTGQPLATPTATATPTYTPTSTDTPQPSPGSIAGRLVNGGSPASGAVVRLEDQGYDVIAETTVNGDGSFEFQDLPASEAGYNVLFSQDWNSGFQSDSIISWGWLGPIAVQDGNRTNLPEFDISASGFKQVNPKAAASFSASQLNANPIMFEWANYPQVDIYWVDLTQGDQQTVVWQSAPTGDTSTAFNGTLSDGSGVQPGAYWWGVGARRNLDGYSLTAYGYLISMAIEP